MIPIIIYLVIALLSSGVVAAILARVSVWQLGRRYYGYCSISTCGDNPCKNPEHATIPTTAEKIIHEEPYWLILALAWPVMLGIPLIIFILWALWKTVGTALLAIVTKIALGSNWIIKELTNPKENV